MTASIGSSGAQSLASINAVSTAQRQQAMFQKLDTDGDGKITEKELKAGIPANGKGPSAAEILQVADTNKDGSIDKSESEALQAKMSKGGQRPMPPPGGGPKGAPPGGGGSSSGNGVKIYDKRDTNKDGKVSLSELLAALEKSTDDTQGSETEAILKKLKQQMSVSQLTPDSYDATGNGLPNSSGNALDAIA